jgi:hypothetical protein
LVDRLRRFGCGEEHAKCGVPREFEAQAVEVVGDGALVARFGESVGAQVRTLTPSARARACSTDKRSIGCTSRSTCETQLSERFISLASSRWENPADAEGQPLARRESVSSRPRLPHSGVGVLRQPVNLEVLDEPIALREELPYVGLLFVGLERCPVPIQLVKDPGLRIVVDRVSDV